MSTHKVLSWIKSIIRMAGYFAGLLAFGDNTLGAAAFLILMVSEVVGIIEEVDEP